MRLRLCVAALLLGAPLAAASAQADGVAMPEWAGAGAADAAEPAADEYLHDEGVPDPGDGPGEVLPVDGGLGLLAAAGAAYAARRLRRRARRDDA